MRPEELHPPASTPRSLFPIGTPGYRICASVAGRSHAELFDRAARALVDTPFIELRLDALPRAAHAGSQLREAITALLARHKGAKLLATCRPTGAGGGFEGSVDEELATLGAAAAAGCTLVDLALESAEEVGPVRTGAALHAIREQGAAVLLSYHDYERTGDLSGALTRLQAFSPDAIKLVSTARTLCDNLAVLRLLEQQGTPVVAMAMGEAGLVSRVLGLRAGSLFTFAASGAGEQTAAGQVPAGTLRDLYRIDRIGLGTGVYGVAGLPIGQSLSPLMHNTAFAVEQIDAVFLPLPSSDARDVLALARALPIAGLSVTMPLKQAIVPLLDFVEPQAERIGACNTIVRTAAGSLHGYNTDVHGILAPLERLLPLKGARVLVQGAGGAARAAVFGLRAAGAEVWIENRTRSRATQLALEAGAQVLPQGNHGELFDVLLQATPSGMTGSSHSLGEEKAGGGPAGVFASAEDQTPLPARIVFDMVYSPLETPLLRKARAQGRTVIPGMAMFVQQGMRQFELWTGRPAPEAEMRQAVLQALTEREAATAPAHLASVE